MNRSELIERLVRCTLDSTPQFTLKGRTLLGRVLDVYDGDTMTVAVFLRNSVEEQPVALTVRLEGIDTCEMKSKSAALLSKAYQARNRLVQLCSETVEPCIESLDHRMKRNDLRKYLASRGAIVELQCSEFDKYGRLLARVARVDTSENFSSILLRELLAYEYQGDTKLTETELEQLLSQTR
jgi:endonuclease YncB( thermonuclease family)